MEQRIRQRLNETLSPVHLQVVNESHMHSVAPGSETHFNVVIVSEAFGGLRLLQRHRAVYGALGEELRTGVHALTMKTLTPGEWHGDVVDNVAPPCLGGSKSDS